MAKNHGILKLLVAAITLFYASPLFAPSEAELMEAALARGKSTEANQIFSRWVNSRDPAQWALVENYLSQNQGLEFIRVLGKKDRLVEEILRSKNFSLYPTALTMLRENGMVGEDKWRASTIQTLYDGIIRAIPQNEFLRTRLLEGSKGVRSLATKRTVGTETVKQYTLEPNANAFAIAKALYEANALKEHGVTEIAYEKGTPTKIQSAEQLDFEKACQWIVKNRQTNLYPYLMFLRSKLTDKTKPTRDEVTKMILAEIDTGTPESSEALKLAVRDGMVQDTKDRYKEKAPALRTLSIDLNDDSDLKLARFLLRAGLPTKPLAGLPGNVGTGLDDVQIILFTRKGEFDYKAEMNNRKSPANHSPQLHVRAAEGELIADLLAERHFERDPKENSLWRKEKYREMAGSYFRDQVWPVGCENLDRLSGVGKAETQTRQ